MRVALQPGFTQAVVNLADLYRIQGREAEGEKILRQALRGDPHHAPTQHALGLMLIGQKRLPEALAALAEAYRLGSDNPRYGYVYAVTLNSVGQTVLAARTLEKVLAKHTHDRDTLMALAGFQRAAGNLNVALDYAQRLAALDADQ